VGTITDAVHDRQRDQSKRLLLQSHPLLARCPPRVIRRVASVADEVTFEPGDVLAEQSHTAKWFFLVLGGCAELARDGTALGVVGGGDHYGEVPLLGRGSHPATLRAITPIKAFVIDCQRFHPLVDDVACIREDLAVSLARQPEMVALARAERAKGIRAARRCSAIPSTVPRAPTPTPTPSAGPLGWEWMRSLGLAQARLRPAPPPPPPPNRARRAIVAAAILAALLGAAALYHPPFAIVRPGPVIDVSHDVVVSGVPAHAPHGRYLLLTVRANRPSLLGLAVADIGGGRTIERVKQTVPATAADLRRELYAEFAQSQRDATAAAAATLGAPGRLPFTVRFRHRDVVGPSAGLIYALAIDDLVSGTDWAGGRVIAATGEVDGSGRVKPVAYVGLKAIGARRAGAQLLLTPVSNAGEAAGVGIPVIPVSSVTEAISRLAAGASAAR
jgi:PDZ domain-containing protein